MLWIYLLRLYLNRLRGCKTANTSNAAEVRHLIFYLRTARKKARAAAQFEALSLLCGLEASAPGGGPLSEKGGVFWIDLPSARLFEALDRLPLLGYTYAVDLLEPTAKPNRKSPDGIRWRGRDFRLDRVYEEDSDLIREAAPDRRPFLLVSKDGRRKLAQGYRGDGKEMSRRALPVCDARLLVNLVRPQADGDTFLDPCAGAGGLLIEARTSGHRVFSLDLDPQLRLGLAELGSKHLVGSALDLPFRHSGFAAIATELPFSRIVEPLLGGIIQSLSSHLRPGGRLAIMAAVWQQEQLRRAAVQAPLELLLDESINRKGTDCAVLLWQRLGE